MIADKIISIAKSYIGEQEILGNKGFKDASFQKDMEAVGWKYGDAWCASFAKMVYLKAYAGTDLGRLLANLMNPSALGTYYNIAHEGTLVTQSSPVPGAIVIFKEGTDPAKHEGHAGIVTDRMGNQFKSIEGNTSDRADIRDGYVVAEKLHILYQPLNPTGLNIVGFIIPNEP
jgi:CHAP domain